jgi:hypothetical protein
MMRRSLMAWLWTLAIVVGSVWAVRVSGTSLVDGFLESRGLAVLPVMFTAMGAVIFARRPGNRIAGILFFIGLGVLLDGLGATTGPEVPADVGGLGEVLILAWNNVGWFVGLIFPLILFLYWYPTGEVMAPRWKAGLGLLALSMTAFLLVAFFSSEVGSPDAGSTWTVTNPIGFVGPRVAGVLQLIMGLTFLASLSGGVAAIAVRFRRSTGVVRQQVKWVMFSLIVFVIVLLVRLFLEQWTGGILFDTLFVASIAFVPVSVAIAITRFRLYDIDRLLSRTVGYSAVIAILVLIYVAGAVWLPTTVVGGEAPLFVAASTLAAAALFNPLRRRVLASVDRRFYRERFDSEEVVQHLADRVRDETDLDSIVDEALAAVSETIQPNSVGIWMKMNSRPGHVGRSTSASK